MDLLIILSYTAICIVVFKVFKIPLTKWTVSTAALGGIILVGTLVLVMNYNHPYTDRPPALTSLVVQLVRVACRPFPYDQKLESLFRAEKAAALGRPLR